MVALSHVLDSTTTVLGVVSGRYESNFFYKVGVRVTQINARNKCAEWKYVYLFIYDNFSQNCQNSCQIRH